MKARVKYTDIIYDFYPYKVDEKSGLIVYKRINRSREPNDLYRVDTLEFIEEYPSDKYEMKIKTTTIEGITDTTYVITRKEHYENY